MHKSVLIVEDEFLIAMNLQFMLEQEGWRVLGSAATVREALRLLAGQHRSVTGRRRPAERRPVHATVTFVALESVLLLSAVRWIERRLTPWTDQVALG